VIVAVGKIALGRPPELLAGADGVHDLFSQLFCLGASGIQLSLNLAESTQMIP
jgi:hypothetical protein